MWRGKRLLDLRCPRPFGPKLGHDQSAAHTEQCNKLCKTLTGRMVVAVIGPSPNLGPAS